MKTVLEESRSIQHLFASLDLKELRTSSEVIAPMIQTLLDIDEAVQIEVAILQKEVLTLSCFQSAHHLSDLDTRWNTYSDVVATCLTSEPTLEQIPDIFYTDGEFIFPVYHNEECFALLYLHTAQTNAAQRAFVEKIGASITRFLVQQYDHFKLKERTLFFEQILDSIPSDLVVFDSAHRYQYINPIAIKDQKVREWLIGKDDFDYVNYRKKDPEIAKKRRAIFNTIIKEKTHHQFEEKAVLPDGKIEWKHRTMYPVMGEDGETVEMVLGYALDITEVKQKSNEVKRANTRLNTLISSLNSGIALVDHHENIVLTNEALCSVFDIDKKPPHLMGKNCAVLYQNLDQIVEDAEAFKSSTQEKLGVGKESFNEEIRCKNGKIFERDFIPIHNKNEHLGYLWQYRDVSQQKQSELELRRALDAERSYSELNKNFVSMVSHEFRTPLTSIQTTAELLTNYVERFSVDDIKKRADRIHKSSVRMDTLVQDVLTIGKLDSESTMVNINEVNIKNLINELIEQLEMCELAGRKVEFVGLNDAQYIHTDPSLLELIFRNLLENAAKYSSYDSNIRFEVRKKKEGYEFVCTDQGMGIPKEEQEFIFEPFKRASNTEGVKGTGLGLPIVQKSVHRLKGELELTSELNKGSTFTVRIPTTNLPD